jgi:hypothetical protein
MRPPGIAESENLEIDDSGGQVPTAAAAFAIIWDALAEMLGTAAAAAIVRRAAARAVPQLLDLLVVRESLEYRYTLPREWSHAGPTALRPLVAEMGQLLVELTGTVVIGRLERLPELRTCGFAWRAGGAN